MEPLRTAGAGPFWGGGQGGVGWPSHISSHRSTHTAGARSHTSEAHFVVIVERHFPRSGSRTGSPDDASAPEPISPGTVLPSALQPTREALVTGWGRDCTAAAETQPTSSSQHISSLAKYPLWTISKRLQAHHTHVPRHMEEQRPRRRVPRCVHLDSGGSRG